MGVLSTYQEQLQDMVNKGIDAAEKHQKRLASKPFDMAEKLEDRARTHSVESLRKSYYGYSENMFAQMRELNSTINEFTAQLISRVEKQATENADSVVEGVDDVAEEVKAAVESVKSAVASEAKNEETASA